MKSFKEFIFEGYSFDKLVKFVDHRNKPIDRQEIEDNMGEGFIDDLKEVLKKISNDSEPDLSKFLKSYKNEGLYILSQNGKITGFDIHFRSFIVRIGD